MDIMQILLNFWYLIIICVPVCYLAYKSNRGQSVLGMEPEKQIAIAEGLLYLLVLYLIQVYIFKDTWFFIISAPFWIILFGAIIYFLLKGNDVYILESTIQNEEFYNLGMVEKVLAPETKQRLLIMDRGIYDLKSHVGDSHYKLWGGSGRIKFTDYYDDNKGVFYHPEVAELHNISFYIAKAFWLNLKKTMPKIMRDNIALTWLSDYKLAHEQMVVKDNFRLMLKNLKEQYEHDPFILGNDIEDIYKKLRKEKQQAPRESEEPKATEPVSPEPVKEVKTSSEAK